MTRDLLAEHTREQGNCELQHNQLRPAQAAPPKTAFLHLMPLNVMPSIIWRLNTVKNASTGTIATMAAAVYSP